MSPTELDRLEALQNSDGLPALTALENQLATALRDAWRERDEARMAQVALHESIESWSRQSKTLRECATKAERERDRWKAQALDVCRCCVEYECECMASD